MDIERIKNNIIHLSDNGVQCRGDSYVVLDNVIDLIFFSVPTRGGINQLKLTLNDLAIAQKVGVTGRDSSNNPARFVNMKDLRYWLLTSAPFTSMVELLHLQQFDWSQLETSIEKSWQLALQWEDERLSTLLTNTETRRQVIRSLRLSPPTTETTTAVPVEDEREDEDGGEIVEAIMADTLLHASPYPLPIHINWHKSPSPPLPRLITTRPNHYSVSFSSSTPPIVLAKVVEEEEEEVLDAIIMPPNSLPFNTNSVDLRTLLAPKEKNKRTRTKPRSFSCPCCHQRFSFKHNLKRHVRLLHGSESSSDDDYK
jgi:hypothetical protein